MLSDKYIEFEILRHDWSHVATIYKRVMEIPNQQLDCYFETFKVLVANHPLSKLRTVEETTAMADANSQENEGEVPPNAAERSSKVVNARFKDAEELKYFAIREEIYKKAKEFNSKIIGFETAIRRPHFHALSLNVVDLENWHNYLDFTEARATMDLAQSALERATQVFVKEKLEDACSLYEQAIAIEKGKENSQTLLLLLAQYSRFVFLVSCNVDKARDILVQGVESAPLSKPLLEAMIYLESIQTLPKQIEYVDTLVEKFIVPGPDNPSIASVDECEELSSIFLEAAYGSYGASYAVPQSTAYETYPQTYQTQPTASEQPTAVATPAPQQTPAAAPLAPYYTGHS